MTFVDIHPSSCKKTFVSSQDAFWTKFVFTYVLLGCRMLHSRQRQSDAAFYMHEHKIYDREFFLAIDKYQ